MPNISVQVQFVVSKGTTAIRIIPAALSEQQS